MTVAELIAKLQEMPQDMPVYIEHDEGGHYELHRIGRSVVEDCEYEYPASGGRQYVVPDSRREFEAMVLS